LWNVTGHFGALMGHGETKGFIDGFFGIFTHSVLPWLSLILAGGGILLAYLIYGTKQLSAERIGGMFKPIYTLLSRKFFLDELYEDVIVRRILVGGLFGGLQKIDTNAVDGTVNGIASGTIAGGRALRKIQTGQLQLYGLFIGLGIVVIILCLYIFG